ncbi:STAS/SEC14 domain-containing protein [candidate division WOR-3 bacterium]|nr:STAS/SEC14 domain-containing protein [candidate division WOR-3 bacterium]
MKHKVWFDSEKDVLREKFVGSFTEDDVGEYLRMMEDVYSSCNHKHVMVDLSEAAHPFYDHKTRQALIEGSGKLRYYDERVAFVGGERDIRELMMELVEGMRHMGKQLRIQFFSTEEEALKWLKREDED